MYGFKSYIEIEVLVVDGMERSFVSVTCDVECHAAWIQSMRSGRKSAQATAFMYHIEAEVSDMFPSMSLSIYLNEYLIGYTMGVDTYAYA